jgi:hypothetical protein
MAFVCGDILAADMSDAEVVYIASLCFDPPFMHALADKLTALPRMECIGMGRIRRAAYFTWPKWAMLTQRPISLCSDHTAVSGRERAAVVCAPRNDSSGYDLAGSRPCTYIYMR